MPEAASDCTASAAAEECQNLSQYEEVVLKHPEQSLMNQLEMYLRTFSAGKTAASQVCVFHGSCKRGHIVGFPEFPIGQLKELLAVPSKAVRRAWGPQGLGNGQPWVMRWSVLSLPGLEHPGTLDHPAAMVL